MTPETQAILEHEIELAVASGYGMNRYFCLVGDKEGRYATPSQNNPSCHPLETIVVGQPILDAINIDIAFNLNVQPQWIDGFVDGYSNSQDSAYMSLPNTDSFKKSYLEGMKDGKAMSAWVRELESQYPAHDQYFECSRRPR